MRNHFTAFPNNTLQFTDYKEKDMWGEMIPYFLMDIVIFLLNIKQSIHDNSVCLDSQTIIQKHLSQMKKEFLII